MRGLVRVDVKQKLKEKNKTIIGHNIISNGALSYMGAEAIYNLVGANNNTANDVYIKTTVNKFGYGSSDAENKFHIGHCISCALLGIGSSSYDNINTSKSFIPLLESDGTVGVDKVRALASIGYSATATVGISDKPLASSFTDKYRIGKRYKFPSGTGTGTVTGIGMLPGEFVPGRVPSGGFITYRRIDETNMFLDRVTYAVKVVMPGIDGLGYAFGLKYTTHDSVKSHVKNMATGELVDGLSTDWYPENYTELSQYDDGDYIYTDYNGYIYKYDKSNNYNRSTSFNYINQLYRALFIYNDTVYNFGCKAGGSGYIASYVGMSGSVTNYTTKSNLATKLLDFGITVPSAWITDDRVYSFMPTTIGNYTGLIVGLSNGTYECYIFSDPTSVISSLVAVIPCLDAKDTVYGYGNYYGVIRNEKINIFDSYTLDGYGYRTGGISDYNVSNMADRSTALKLIGTGSEYFKDAFYGVYVSIPGQFANWLSIKELETSVNKTSETDIYVQYDYQFASTDQTNDSAITGTQSTTRG